MKDDEENRGCFDGGGASSSSLNVRSITCGPGRLLDEDPNGDLTPDSRPVGVGIGSGLIDALQAPFFSSSSLSSREIA